MSWLRQNYELVLTIALSWVIDGIIGFFTAVLTVRGEISDLRERIARLEAYNLDISKQKMSIVDSHVKEILKVKSDINFLKQKNDLSSQNNNLLSLIREKERKETVTEIRLLIQDTLQKSGTK